MTAAETRHKVRFNRTFHEIRILPSQRDGGCGICFVSGLESPEAYQSVPRRAAGSDGRIRPWTPPGAARTEPEPDVPDSDLRFSGTATREVRPFVTVAVPVIRTWEKMTARR